MLLARFNHQKTLTGETVSVAVLLVENSESTCLPEVLGENVEVTYVIAFITLQLQRFHIILYLRFFLSSSFQGSPRSRTNTNRGDFSTVEGAFKT